MQLIERYLTLLFGAIVLLLILSNPEGINAITKGLAQFTSGTVSAFRGGGITGAGLSLNA